MITQEQVDAAKERLNECDREIERRRKHMLAAMELYKVARKEWMVLTLELRNQESGEEAARHEAEE